MSLIGHWNTYCCIVLDKYNAPFFNRGKLSVADFGLGRKSLIVSSGFTEMYTTEPRGTDRLYSCQIVAKI